jgi:hypothetical protein
VTGAVCISGLQIGSIRIQPVRKILIILTSMVVSRPLLVLREKGGLHGQRLCKAISETGRAGIRQLQPVARNDRDDAEAYQVVLVFHWYAISRGFDAVVGRVCLGECQEDRRNRKRVQVCRGPRQIRSRDDQERD